MGWFAAELLDEVRAARAEDVAERSRRSGSARRTGSARRLGSAGRGGGRGKASLSPDVRAQRFGAAVVARVGRFLQLGGWALQVLVLAWLAATYGAGAVLVGLTVIGVLAALRTIAANCAARRWRGWSGLAVAASVAIVAGVVVWLVVGPRPIVAVAAVGGQMLAAAGFAVMREARSQGGPAIVVV